MAIEEVGDVVEAEPDASTVEGLIELVEAQRSLLTSVATGGPGIDSVDAEYQGRRTEIIRGLKRLGLDNPLPWRSLWDWYGLWSSGDYPSYASRRQYIRELTAPLRDELERRREQAAVLDWGPTPETWDSLEARLDALKGELGAASTLDDWQDVGRRAREIEIDAANLVFDESMVTEGEEVPHGSDAKNRIVLYLDAQVPGSAHAELRKLMRSALELANKVTHSSSITRPDAFAAAQATVLLVRTLQVIEEEAQP